MGKKNNSKRAKRKAEKELKRKRIVKQKMENIRKSNRDTKEKKLEISDTVKGLQSDIREQVRNIDDGRTVCRALQKFTFTVVTKRLDIPYLTDEVRDKLKGLHERATNTIENIDDIRRKFVETAIKIQDPGALSADMESLNKFSEVLEGAQELMNMQSSLVDFGAECTRIIRDLNTVIKECDDLREANGDMSIMPIATPEEREFLGIHLNLETYEFENKETGELADIVNIPKTIDTEVTELPKEESKEEISTDEIKNEEVKKEDVENVEIKQETSVISNRQIIHYDNNGKRIES